MSAYFGPYLEGSARFVAHKPHLVGVSSGFRRENL